MQQEINLKYLCYELIRKWKIIIAVGIIAAIVATSYAVVSGSLSEQAYDYGAFAKITIEEDGIFFGDKASDTQFTNMAEAQDYAEKYVSIITSDKVLQQIIDCSEFTNVELNLEDIRGMIYPRGKSNGSIIELNVIAKDQAFAASICEKLISYGTDALDLKGLETEVVQGVTELGAVSVEFNEDKNDPRDSIVIIKPITISQGITAIDLAKKAMIGFIIGLFVAALCTCIMFILRDRIVYADQIEESTGIKLISDFGKTGNYLELYSAISLKSPENSIINFISLKELKSANNFVEKFADIIGGSGQKVAVVKNVNETKNTCDFSFESKSNYLYAEINDTMLIQKDFIKNKVAEIEDDYDYIFFHCDGIDKNPVGKLVSKEADNTVVLIEPNNVSVKELCDLKNTYGQAGIAICGVAFIS